MADWDDKPDYAYPIRREGPVVLRTVFEDQKELRRRKSSVIVLIVREIFPNVTKTVADAMEDFYELKGTDIAFTKRTYDAQDAVDATANFRFQSPVIVIYQGYDSYRVIADFRQDIS